MMVYTRLVSGEVSVDGESSLNGTVGLNLSLNLGNVASNTVNAGCLVDVVSVGSGITTRAGLSALGGGRITSAGSVLSSGMMVAWGKRVRLAVVAGVVKPSGNETGALEVVPGSLGVSSVASLSTAETAAREQVLSRNSGLILLSTGNTDTVAHGFDGTEGPARTAVGLITEFLDGVTSRPGSP